MRRRFNLAHSFLGLALLLIAQAIVSYALPAAAAAFMLIASVVGAGLMLFFSTEAIEEVRNASHMLATLLAVVAEFVALFAVEYWFALSVAPGSFPTLPPDAVGYLLQSIMVFVFNPLYLPDTLVGRALLLINTASALGLVLFVMQNVAQIRRLGQHPFVPETQSHV